MSWTIITTRASDWTQIEDGVSQTYNMPYDYNTLLLTYNGTEPDSLALSSWADASVNSAIWS